MPNAHEETFEQLLRRVAETPPAPHGGQQIRSGARVAGRFEIIERLGEGGMGQVFAALDCARDMRVAVKVLGNLRPESIAQIKREFRAAAEIVNPNLVRLHELIACEDLWFFTMDLVEGASLTALLRKRPDARTDGEMLRSTFRELALGLTALHEAGTLHGDLKPSNFLITEPEHRVVLLDFGLARPTRGPATRDVAGTPGYMAPEQLRGEELTEAADWYAFGVVLHEALSGQLPQACTSAAWLDGAPPDLARLCLQLLSFHPGDRPRGEEVLHRLGISSGPRRATRAPECSTLIGRRRELDALHSAFEETLVGQSAMVLVQGPSGIGKSALVEHFTRIALQRGALLLTGRCRERESMGYKAVDGLIDSIVGFLDGLPQHEALALVPPEISDLTTLFPSLRAARALAGLPTRGTEIPDRAMARQRAIVAFRAMLASFRRRAPVVVWVDDLQWSDEESALLLGPVLGGAGSVPLLFIGSSRSGSAGRGPLLEAMLADRSLRFPDLKHLRLDPLPPEQSERLALHLLTPSVPDASEVALKICGEARGHPLFIAELVHSVRDASRSSRAASCSTLLDLVNQRVATLPVAARDFLDLTVVAGAPLALGVVRQVQGIGPAEARLIVDSLRAHRMVRTEGLTDEDLVDLHHDRIREIIVQGMPRQRQLRCHLGLARALETRRGTKPELIATHYEAAGELPSAGLHWALAADQAFLALAFGHAAELCQKALVQATLTDSEVRALTIRKAEAHAYAGQGAHSAEAYLAAADLCLPDQALELRRRAAEQLLLSGHIGGGLAVIEDVLRTLEMPATQGGRRAMMSLVARRALLRVRGLRHRVRSESELTTKELAQLDASWTISSLGALDFIRGAEFQSKHLLLALRAGEPRRLLRALTLEAGYAATPGAGSERRTTTLVGLAEELAQRSEDDTSASLLCLTRGVTAYLQGRLYDALKHCDEAIYILTRRSVGAVWEMVTAQRFMIASLYFLGRLRRLAAAVPPLLAEAERNGNLYAMMCFRSAYSTVAWLAVDAVPEARRQLDWARIEWKGEGFQFPHCNLLIGETLVDMYAGDAEKAFARLEEHWPFIVNSQLHRIGVLRVQLGQFRACSALLMASVLERRGQRARARELRGQARRAARRLCRDPVRRAAPLGDLIHAALDRSEGEIARARGRIEHSIRAFDEQGMELFSAAASVRLGALSGDRQHQLLADTARAGLSREGVANPARMVDLLAPGFLDG